MSNAARVRLVVAAGAALVALSQAAYSQNNPYQTLENHFKLPEGRKIGSTAGITIDRDGTSVWVFERCGGQDCVGSNVAPILKFDASGKLVKSFGAGMFVRPHGIHVDREGNVWVTDGEGPDGKDARRNGKGHQVFKFSPDGKVLMTLGKAGVAGEGPDTFNHAVRRSGRAKRRYLHRRRPWRELERPHREVLEGRQVHQGVGEERDRPRATSRRRTRLAMDSRGRLFVGDRGNNRIQIFDQDGKFLEEWKQFGRPSGLFIDRNDTLYLPTTSRIRRRTQGSEKASGSGARRTAR